jgi:hypothetical protein
MHICYMDDSGEDNVRAFSLLTVPAHEWKACFGAIKDYRRKLRDSDGIYMQAELHATKFLSGHGVVSPKRIHLQRRCEIYRDCVAATCKLPGVRLFNAIGKRQNELRLFERLLNRLNRAMTDWDSHAVIVSDDGKDYTKLARKMAVFNPIPSMFGRWPRAGLTRNITIDRLIDDLFYRRSRESYFIQVVDFCVYGLLRSEKHLAAKDALGIHTVFDQLQPICQTQCFRNDPRKLGIIRDT